jgi:hypothetical protein
MFKTTSCIVLVIALLMTEVESDAQTGCASGLQIHGYPPVSQGALMQDKLGVTTTGFLYQYDPTVSSLEEGQYRLGTNTTQGYTDTNLGAGLGTHVIKIWFDYNDLVVKGYPNSHTTTATYPNMSISGNPNSYFGTVNSLTDLASSPPMKELFSNPDFNTYILEAGEFCQKTTGGAWEGTLWRSTDGTSFNFGTSVQNCVYNDFYSLTKYLLQTYSGSGKTFVLQNWEGDNALNPSQFTVPPTQTETCTNPSAANYPGAFCQTVLNMRTWLNLRWQGVNDARGAYEASTSKVTVAAAAEVNLVDGYNTSSYPYPTAMDIVIPQLHMDLYSCSCYHSSLPPYGQTVNPMLQVYQSKIVQPVLAVNSEPTLYGANNIYIGEFNAPEYHWYSDDDWTETTSRLARMNTSQQVQGALAANARWIVYWQVYTNDVVGESGNTIAGYWLIRPPCNSTDGTQSWCTDSSHTGQPGYSQTWNFFQNVMPQPYSTYQYVYEAENFFTTITNTGSELDVADSNMTGGYGTELQGAAVNSVISYSMYVPTTGTQTLSIRVRTGSANGFFAVHLNGAALPGTFDTFASASGYPTFTITTQSIPSGTTTVDLVVTGKNSSSSGYNLVIDNISIVPTSGHDSISHVVSSQLGRKLK